MVSLVKIIAIPFTLVCLVSFYSYAGDLSEVDKEKWGNSYKDFDADSDNYRDYAKARNRLLYRAVGNRAKSLTCAFYKKNNHKIEYLNPGDEVDVSFVDSSGVYTEQRMIVGQSLGESFGCMGACGPSCPTRGLPSAFTMDCLKHDLCVYSNGIDNNLKRSDHPLCGDLFNEAIDDWCEEGHMFQDNFQKNPTMF